MAWLQIHQTLRNHRKLLSAADMLDITPPHMIGLLVSFWLWSLDNAPSGKLNGISPKIIAHAAQWEGDPDQFVEVMKSTEWLDETVQGAEIHDWYEYAGKLIDQRIEERERSRKRRSISSMSNNRPPDDRRTTAGQSSDDRWQSRVDQSREENNINDVFLQANPFQTDPFNENENENENENTKEKIRKPKIDKTKYSDYVNMKPKEYDTLVEDYGELFAKACIQKLDFYKGAKGKTYKDDYRAILSWVVDEIKKTKPDLVQPIIENAKNKYAEPPDAEQIKQNREFMKDLLQGVCGGGD